MQIDIVSVPPIRDKINAMSNTQKGILGLADGLARSAIQDYPADKTRWHYEHGLFFQSLLSLGTALGQPFYEDFTVDRMNLLLDSEGKIPSYRKDEFNLDQVNPGKALWALYDLRKDPRYLNAIKVLRGQLDQHPRTELGPFWHKNIYPHQVWLDGQYMQAPFYARCAQESGSSEDFDDLSRQLIQTRDVTKDPMTGLYAHAWDESRQMPWADKQTGKSPHFWGRALGWYAMALVDVLDYLPSGHSNRAELLGIIKDLAEALEEVKDTETGLWFQILDQGGRAGNYIETSCSAMFCYFYAKAANNGLLDAGWGRTAEARVQALYDLFVTEDERGLPGLNEVCAVAGLGGTPYRDGSYEYYVGEPRARNDFKGLGPLLLASVQIEKSRAKS